MSGKIVKVIGLMATVVGVGASLITDWVEDKKMDEKIEKRVNEAIARREEES